MWVEAGRPAKATPVDAQADAYPAGAMGEGFWRLAWSAYQAGETDDAINWAIRMAAESPSTPTPCTSSVQNTGPLGASTPMSVILTPSARVRRTSDKDRSARCPAERTPNELLRHPRIESPAGACA